MSGTAASTGLSGQTWSQNPAEQLGWGREFTPGCTELPSLAKQGSQQKPTKCLSWVVPSQEKHRATLLEERAKPNAHVSSVQRVSLLMLPTSEPVLSSDCSPQGKESNSNQPGASPVLEGNLSTAGRSSGGLFWRLPQCSRPSGPAVRVKT